MNKYFDSCTRYMRSCSVELMFMFDPLLYVDGTDEVISSLPDFSG